MKPNLQKSNPHWGGVLSPLFAHKCRGQKQELALRSLVLVCLFLLTSAVVNARTRTSNAKIIADKIGLDGDGLSHPDSPSNPAITYNDPVTCPVDIVYTMTPCVSVRSGSYMEELGNTVHFYGYFVGQEEIVIVYTVTPGGETLFTPSSVGEFMNSTNQGTLSNPDDFASIGYQYINQVVNPDISETWTRVWRLEDISGNITYCNQLITVNLIPAETATIQVFDGECAGNNRIEFTSPLGPEYEYSINFGETWQSDPLFTNVPIGLSRLLLKNNNQVACPNLPPVIFDQYICGTVFNDANANTIIDNSELGLLPDNTPLYVYLSNELGNITGKGTVETNGEYKISIPNIADGKFLYLSSNEYDLYDFDSNISQDLPALWLNTGENGDNNSGPGDGTPDGILLVDLGQLTLTNQNFGIRDPSILPVTLVAFNAKRREGTSSLVWITTEETNSDHFEIQHSQDAMFWTAVGKVAASGKSETVKNYEFTHYTPVSGTNYYRLKMIDRDATFANSRVVSLHFGSGKSVNVYPNPVSQLLQIQVTNNESIQSVEIIDLTGKTVYRKLNGLAEVLSKGIDISKLQQGSYALRIKEQNGVVTTSKIIVVR